VAETVIRREKCTCIQEFQVDELRALYSKLWTVAKFHQRLIRRHRCAPVEKRVVLDEIGCDTPRSGHV
jgi:hypothetical protein